MLQALPNWPASFKLFLVDIHLDNVDYNHHDYDEHDFEDHDYVDQHLTSSCWWLVDMILTNIWTSCLESALLLKLNCDDDGDDGDGDGHDDNDDDGDGDRLLDHLSSISDAVEVGVFEGIDWNFSPVQSVTVDVQEQPSGHCKNGINQSSIDQKCK